MGANPASAEDLLAAARDWAAHDPDPRTRAELLALVAAGDLDVLHERFAGPLRFGTAGLRGVLGAGPSCMNRAVVRCAASGLASWLHERRGPSKVVVGRDARHGSADFAEDSARVLAAAGHTALVLPGVVPTPLVAFAVRHLRADAGVMVTASHNPPGDNGYKVYLSDGAQVIPPADAEIAAAIDAAPPADEVPLADADDARVERVGDEVAGAYVSLAAGVGLTGSSGPASGAPDVTVAYTPLHGVGWAIARRVFAAAGFDGVHVVGEQAEPDPDFPTVPYPNPEEPGAMDLVLALADDVGADVVLANDPDADRLGVAVPGTEGWRVLSGNEIGALLADHVLATTSGRDRLVVTTTVSSRLLRRQAEHAGVHYAEVPTGFKWVVRPGLETPGRRFVFGYEEALGYSVLEAVRDKDGITAALAFARLVADLRATGDTVDDRLADLAVRFGHHATTTAAFRLEGRVGRERIADAMAALRSRPPSALGHRRVVEVVDHAADPGRTRADLVELVLPDGRVLVRPSGTESKLKLYVEVVVPVEGGRDGEPAARRRGDEAVQELADATGAVLGLD